ncbi:hypothetical protein FRC12_011169 [Ceratobasidium sp. 428]|nr:hypothetical protein FRC12_011169 [Ceratobasidium sp. 428]
MVSLSALSTIALMIASGVVAAPWFVLIKSSLVTVVSVSFAYRSPPIQHHTHRIRGVSPSGTQLKSYHPPAVFEGYGVDGVTPPLATGTSEETAMSFLQNKLNATSDSLVRRSGYTFDGVFYEYFSQIINGLPVSNAVANVAIKDGKVMSYGASFVRPQGVPSAIPKLTSLLAIKKAEQALGGKYNNWPTELEYFVKDNGFVVLTHVVQVQDMHSGGLKQSYIDANSGELVNVVDFVADSSYHVVPFKFQDPTTGYTTEVDPAIPDASPNGWHKSGNRTTTDTSGNNAISYKGIGRNPLPVNTPSIPIPNTLTLLNGLIYPTTSQSSPENNFNYTYDDSKAPTAGENVRASIVNAFYVVNCMHDLTYRYGFTESAFNFQNDNFGKGGQGNDPVLVSVQDMSGTNNANFLTPPDGQSGQMRMYTWTYTTPGRDGAMENDIVTHEMMHGVSNRLTGGGSGRCLQSTEAGGMGEGWSDWMASIVELKSDDVPDFTMGSYVTNNPAGIRTHPYSTSATTNPLRYSSVKTLNEVHNIGEVWANMLYNVLAALVDAHGFSGSDGLKDPAKPNGNNVALHLVMGGLALQPCSPTFLTARDAIIQADANRYNGANKCTLWKSFASRGLGVGAANYVDSTDVPPECK